MAKPWLTGRIGATRAESPHDEIKAVIGSLDYAKDVLGYSNFDCGNIDKAIKLLKSHLPKRERRKPRQ